MRPWPALRPVDVPFPVVVPYRPVPAPRPLGDAPHMVLDAGYPQALRRRLERLSHDPEGILVRHPAAAVHPHRPGPPHPPGAPHPPRPPHHPDRPDRSHPPDDEGLADALRAAWRLLPFPRDGHEVHLPLLGVRVDLARARARADGPSCSPAATEALLGRSGLGLLAAGWQLACADDLVVLRRAAPGVVRAELLAVAFPSGWAPRHRAGATLAELHAPVADAARLRRASPALSEALLTKGPYLQHVWGLNPEGRLDRDPSAPDAPAGLASPPGDWWLRVERQTTLPLPGLDRALFLIRPYLVPLRDLPGPRRRVLHDAVASMSPAALAYKGLVTARDPLLAWL